MKNSVFHKIREDFLGWGTLRTFLQQTVFPCSVTELLKQHGVAWKTSQPLFSQLLSFCIHEFSLLQESGREETSF